MSSLIVVFEAQVFGGAERQLVAVLERLPPEVVVTALVVQPAPEQLLEALRTLGVKVRAVRAVSGKLHIIRLIGLAVRMMLARGDLVHVNMSTATNNRHALIAARLARRRTVVSVHSLAALDSPLQRRHLRAAVRGVCAAMVPSRAIAEQMVHTLGMPADRVAVVRNGVADFGLPTRRAGDAPAALRIVTVGRLSFEKGHDLLLEACRSLMKSRLAFEVVIVGDGPERSALEQLASGLPVRFSGEVQDVSPLLREADIYCQPARTEGLPLALLEAMMAGLPCVATAVGDVPTLDPAVVLVPPADVPALAFALQSLLTDPKRRAALAAEARSRAVTDHTVDQSVRAVFDVYAGAMR